MPKYDVVIGYDLGGYINTEIEASSREDLKEQIRIVATNEEIEVDFDSAADGMVIELLDKTRQVLVQMADLAGETDDLIDALSNEDLGFS